MSFFSNKALSGHITRIIFALSICLPATAAQAESKATMRPADVPLEAFASLPNFSRAQLSRNGKKIAYFITMKGRNHLIIQNLDGSDRTLVPPVEKAEIIHYSWANDDILLVHIGFQDQRWGWSGQTYETRIFALDIRTGEFTWLGKPKNAKLGRSAQFVSQHERVVDFLPNDPDHILMQMDFELDGAPSVYKVNITNGLRTVEKRGRGGIQNWYTDQKSEVRLGFGYREAERRAMLKLANGDWIDLTDTEWENRYKVQGFSPEENIIYVSGSTEYGTRGLYKLDLTTGKVTERIFAHKQVNMDYIIEHPITGRIAGVAYTDDYDKVRYFDKDLAVVQASMEKAMEGLNVTITGRAYDREMYLALVSDGTTPGDYFIYDRPERKMHYIAAVNQQIGDAAIDAPGIFRPAEAVAIPVRDGSSIPGYLVLPSDRAPRNLPAIVMPHGGPSGRDSAEWDWWAQFYASRGYVVLQPNYRGSTGYGPRFAAAGEHQWGGLMQDDVTDATKWLSSEGIADPKRICIVGASYGGYAALMGTIKEKDLYACAISVNGVTDLPRLKSDDKNYIGGKVWTKKMGLKGVKDEEVSPYDRAADISAPVLLMSSKDDERVEFKFSEDMDKKLRKLKKDSRYVRIDDGGHQMRTSASRLTVLQETEKFLAKHIGK